MRRPPPGGFVAGGSRSRSPWPELLGGVLALAAWGAASAADPAGPPAEVAIDAGVVAKLAEVVRLLGDGRGGAAIDLVDETIAATESDESKEFLAWLRQRLVPSLRVDPEPAAFLNCFAWSVVERGGQDAAMPPALVTLAIEAAERAVALDPREGNIMDTLAHLQALRGDVAAALATQRRAAEHPGLYAPQIYAYLVELEARAADAGVAADDAADKAELAAVVTRLTEVTRLLSAGRCGAAVDLLDEAIAAARSGERKAQLATMRSELTVAVSGEYDPAAQLNQFAWSIVELADQHDALPGEFVTLGLAAAERAVALDPEHGNHMDTLAHLQTLRGDVAAALATQRKAAEHAGIYAPQINAFLTELEALAADK